MKLMHAQATIQMMTAFFFKQWKQWRTKEMNALIVEIGKLIWKNMSRGGRKPCKCASVT